MEARLDHDWAHDSWRVWLFDRRGGSMMLHRPGPDGYWRIDQVEDGDKAEPSLVIPAPALEALVAAASDHLPPSAATDRHLNDAISVRDRLLAMIEKDQEAAINPRYEVRPS